MNTKIVCKRKQTQGLVHAMRYDEETARRLSSIEAIQRGHTTEKDEVRAIEELHRALDLEGVSLLMFFCSPTYDRSLLAEAMGSKFSGVELVGCTTAGEIGPDGFTEGGISAMTFPAAHFRFSKMSITDLAAFRMSEGQGAAKAAWTAHVNSIPSATTENSFAMLLIDGMSVREEQVTRALQTGLGEVPLVGGSAADGMAFGKTFIFHDGGFHTNHALCILGTTDLPFRVFKTQHFDAMDERMVVTEADGSRRIVREINGFPAAQEYARVLNTNGANLDPAHFASSPVVVMIDGTNYVRSIQQANTDGSLTFFCAIEEGLVFRVARGNGLLENLYTTMDALKGGLGGIQGALVFDCILRRLELAQSNDRDAVARLLVENGAVGFNTYGEQYHGVHVNQTLVGIAFGEVRA